MPRQRDIQERRREAIRKMLMKSDPPVEEQKDLLERLKAMGIPATQSSVSRDLNEMRVMWIPGHYELPSWFDEDEPFQRTRGLVLSMANVERSLLLLVTQPGAGGFVAEAIDASKWDYVLGVVSGYSSVLVVTENEFFRQIVAQTIDGYLSEKKGEEKEKP